VISQSIRKSDSQTKEFALSCEGWEHTLDGNGNVVSMIKERTIPRRASTYGDVDDKKHSGTYNERQVFIWSKKYSDRAKRERQAVLEKALQSEGRRSKDYKDSSYGKSKYLRKSPVKAGELYRRLVLYESTPRGWRRREVRRYYLICTMSSGSRTRRINPDKRPACILPDSDGFWSSTMWSRPRSSGHLRRCGRSRRRSSHQDGDVVVEACVPQQAGQNTGALPDMFHIPGPGKAA
jgi:hypothetical protein